jgi:hypothetical protein
LITATSSARRDGDLASAVEGALVLRAAGDDVDLLVALRRELAQVALEREPRPPLLALVCGTMFEK